MSTNGTHQDPIAIAQQWLNAFAAGFRANDAQAVAATFQPGGFLRDVLTFMWDYHTLEGRENIQAYLSDKFALSKVSGFALTNDPYLQPKPFQMGPLRGIEFAFKYQTPTAHGQGFTRLIEDKKDGWQGHIVAMIVMDLKGHEEPTRRYSFEEFVNGKSWGDYMHDLRASWEKDPHVLVGAHTCHSSLVYF